jgi:hypothetical protein
MRNLRKVLGLFWMLLAGLCAYFGFVFFGYPKIVTPKGSDDLVFGCIILFVLLPLIVGGLFLFGWYAINGEYDSEE